MKYGIALAVWLFLCSFKGCKADCKRDPAFFVTLWNGPFTLNGIDDVLKFDRVKLNSGEGYNRKTGYFVCPKTGLYHLSATILSNHDHVVHFQLNINQEGYVQGYCKKGAADSSTVSAVAKLYEGDKVFIKHRYTNNMEQIHGLDLSSFSGYYIRE